MERSQCTTPNPVTITGISGRFPESRNIEEFWFNLLQGKDMCTENDSRMPIGYMQLPARTGKIPNIDKFDSDFFNLTDQEANSMDPQFKICHETTFEAILDAGLDPDDLRGSRTGMFFGYCFADARMAQLQDDNNTNEFIWGEDHSQISKYFGFKGPCFTYDSACASSFSAFNEAVKLIQSNVIDTALVAGVTVCTSSFPANAFRQLGMTSKDGTCRCMDMKANGYVRSETIATIVLQRKSVAKRIYSIVVNTKTNSDGYKKEGITFPGYESMIRLMSQTYEEVNLNPKDTKYIEGHVTGTQAGDPVECDAIEKVFCPKDRKDQILIGCLKSNMGHAEGSSGIAAMTKACLIMQKGLIPPNINYNEPNHNISGLLNGKLKPVIQVEPFEGSVISFNSFGFGGSNVHAIIKTYDGVNNVNIHDITGPKNINRLVLLKSRTLESFELLRMKIENSPYEITTESLALLDNIAQLQSRYNLPYRGYFILDQDMKIVKCDWIRNVDPDVYNSENIEIRYENNLIEPWLQNIIDLLKSANLNIDIHSILHEYTVPETGRKSAVIKTSELTLKVSESTHLNEILSIIGQCYMTKYDVKLDNLYPPIEYPVSKRTMSLSPLISWDHSKTWTVFKVPDYFRWEAKAKRFNFDYSGIYNHLNGHVIDGRILFPATQYLWTIWQSLAMELIENHPMAFLKSGIKFWDVQLNHAIMVDEGDEISFVTRTNPITGSFEIVQNKTCLVYGNATLTYDQDVPFDNVTKKAGDVDTSSMISQRDFYKELRVRGYDYEHHFKGVKHCYQNGTGGVVSFLKNWVCFADAVLQLALINDKSRSLQLPTGIGVLQIDAKVFKNISKEEYSLHKNISKSSAVEENVDDIRKMFENVNFDINNNETKNEDVENLFDVTVRDETSEIFTNGFYIKGLKTSSATRKNIVPNITRYNFMPFNQTCEHSESDFIPMDHPYIRHQLQVVSESFFGINLRVSEVNMNSESNVRDQLEGKLFDPDTNYTLYSDALQKQDQAGNEMLSIKEYLNQKSLESHLTIIHDCSRNDTDVRRILSFTAIQMNIGSFVMLLARNADLNRNLLSAYGLKMISKKVIGEFVSFLARKLDSHSSPPKVFEIETFNYDWVDELRDQIYIRESDGTKTQSDSDPFWVLSKDDTTGLQGLFNCIRREDTRFRGIMIMDQDVNQTEIDSIIKTCIEYNLPLAMFKDGQLGTILSDVLSDSNDYLLKNIQADNVEFYRSSRTLCLDIASRGDLSSLKYFETMLQPKSGSIIDVHYAALNFKDVMVASGRIAESAYPKSFSAPNSGLLGMEFSGTDSKGQRVMGIIPSDAIATKVSVKGSEEILYSVPDWMTLEDAATIPVVYSTVYYALIMRGKLLKNESVLIHAGSGGVGQAAINICLSMNCDIYTTVGTEEKREFIKKTYPTIEDDHILDSRSDSFGDAILIATSGRGVDVVLNSLSEDKLFVGLSCSAVNGRFIEIGKYDMITNSSFDPIFLQANQTFQSVCLAFLMSKVSEFKQEGKHDSDMETLRNLMEEGLKNGIVRPLTRHVFSHDQAEDAFRFMATGKHIGKVLINMNHMMNNSNIAVQNPIAISNRVSFNPSKSYIVIGGLGGIGLEFCHWLVMKGARFLIITSRSGIKTAYQEYFINRLKSFGTKIFVSKNDVSDIDQAIDVIAQAQTYGEVGGVFNLAMVIKDALFEDQSKELFEEACNIKIRGTYNLDQITRKICPNLEHFLCFSSMVSTFGNTGQSNYGFANAFMDNLCAKRRSDNLPGISIGWGAIGDVGHVAENMGHDVIVVHSAPQRINSCFDVLERVWYSSDPIMSSHVQVDWTKLETKGDALTAILHILGIKDISKLDPKDTLGNLGLDSLMAIEIKQVLEKKYELLKSTKEIRELSIETIKNLSKDAAKNKKISEKVKDANITDESLELEIILPSNLFVPLNDIKSGNPIFILAPIDGSFNHMKDVLKSFSKVERPLIGINWIKENDSHETFEDVANYYLEQIEGKYRDISCYDLIGYSFGAFTAMEMALQSDKVGKLVLLDMSPNYGKYFLNGAIGNDSGNKNWIQFCINHFTGLIKEGKFDFDTKIKEVPTDANFQKYYQVIKSSNASLNDSDWIAIFDRIRRKFKMMYSYDPQEVLSRDVMLIRASDGISGENNTDIARDYELSKHVLGTISVIKLDGDHHSFLSINAHKIAKGILEYFN